MGAPPTTSHSRRRNACGRSRPTGSSLSRVTRSRRCDRIGDDGRIAAVGPSAEVGRGERFDDAVILPGAGQRAYAPRVRRVCRVRRRPAVRALDRMHVRRKARLELADMEAIARVGAADCLRSGSRRSATRASPAQRRPPVRELGLRAVVYLEVFGGAESVASASSRRASDSTGTSGHRSGSASRRTRRTRAHRSCTRLASRSGCRSRRISRRARRGPVVRDGSGAVAGSPPSCWSTTPGRSGSGRSPSAGSCPGCSPRTASPSTTKRSGSSQPRRAVAHCPRSNGISAAGRARRCVRAQVARLTATDSPASTPVFDMFDELRTAVVGARARERDVRSAPARRRARAGDARRCPRPGSRRPGRARSSPANKPTSPSSHSKAPRSTPWRTQPRRWFWAAPPDRVLLLS